MPQHKQQQQGEWIVVDDKQNTVEGEIIDKRMKDTASSAGDGVVQRRNMEAPIAVLKSRESVPDRDGAKRSDDDDDNRYEKDAKPQRQRTRYRRAFALFVLLLLTAIAVSKSATNTWLFRNDHLIRRHFRAWRDNTWRPGMRLVTAKLRRVLRVDRIFTAEELEKYSGENPDLPVYLSFNREVFDVTAGRSTYTRGSGVYGTFGGRDATRSYITGEFDLDTTCDLTGLTEKQITEGIAHWSDFYHDHEKYFKIGVMADEFVCPRALTPEELGEAKKKLKAEREAARLARREAKEAAKKQAEQEKEAANKQAEQEKEAR